MKTYCVGGAVRDRLLGLAVKDRDYVVVGATPEQMTALGYKPVGKDFPVFLHPHTRDEYALARTERKSGHGYKGFTVYAAPDVTLEQDLARRDLTINAMAEDEAGNLIDPYQGQNDLKAGLLRHVSDAFVEDPVRILRAARFAARYRFTIAAETMALMQQMVQAGEVDHLVAERVWQEFAKGLMEQMPSIMIRTLRDCGALARVLPEIEALFSQQGEGEILGEHTLRALDYAASEDWDLPTRFAVLCHDLAHTASPEQGSDTLIQQLCDRIKAPAEMRELASLACNEGRQIDAALSLSSEALLDLLLRGDAFRRPERFIQLMDSCVAAARGRSGQARSDYPQALLLSACMSAGKRVDGGAIARATINSADIPQAIRAARLQAVITAQQGILGSAAV